MSVRHDEALLCDESIGNNETVSGNVTCPAKTRVLCSSIVEMRVMFVSFTLVQDGLRIREDVCVLDQLNRNETVVARK